MTQLVKKGTITSLELLEQIEGKAIIWANYVHNIEAITNKIIELYEAMLNVGFSRLDSALFHIFITPSNNLKLIDTAKSLKKKTIYPYLIINGLDDFGYKNQFLDYLKFTRSDLYNKWIKYL